MRKRMLTPNKTFCFAICNGQTWNRSKCQWHVTRSCSWGFWQMSGVVCCVCELDPNPLGKEKQQQQKSSCLEFIQGATMCLKSLIWEVSVPFHSFDCLGLPLINNPDRAHPFKNTPLYAGLTPSKLTVTSYEFSPKFTNGFWTTGDPTEGHSIPASQFKL